MTPSREAETRKLLLADKAIHSIQSRWVYNRIFPAKRQSYQNGSLYRPSSEISNLNQRYWAHGQCLQRLVCCHQSVLSISPKLKRNRWGKFCMWVILNLQFCAEGNLRCKVLFCTSNPLMNPSSPPVKINLESFVTFRALTLPAEGHLRLNRKLNNNTSWSIIEFLEELEVP